MKSSLGCCKEKGVLRHYLPESPAGTKVSLVAVGSTQVGWIAATTTQCTERGVRIRPRGTAATEELICRVKRTTRVSSFFNSRNASGFVLTIVRIMQRHTKFCSGI
jgi:hypothetical protein